MKDGDEQSRSKVEGRQNSSSFTGKNNSLSLLDLLMNEQKYIQDKNRMLNVTTFNEMLLFINYPKKTNLNYHKHFTTIDYLFIIISKPEAFIQQSILLFIQNLYFLLFFEEIVE